MNPRTLSPIVPAVAHMDRDGQPCYISCSHSEWAAMGYPASVVIGSRRVEVVEAQETRTEELRRIARRYAAGNGGQS